MVCRKQLPFCCTDKIISIVFVSLSGQLSKTFSKSINHMVVVTLDCWTVTLTYFMAICTQNWHYFWQLLLVQAIELYSVKHNSEWEDNWKIWSLFQNEFHVCTVWEQYVIQKQMCKVRCCQHKHYVIVGIRCRGMCVLVMVKKFTHLAKYITILFGFFYKKHY